MKRSLRSLFLTSAMTASSATFATDVGVSVQIGDPNFYGRIDIGNFPQPRVIYPEPVIIERAGHYGPIYLRVPPGHAKDWKKHCKHYNACARPVYFVQDDWYQLDYAPAYREKQGKDKGPKDNPGHGNKGQGKGHGKD